MAICGHTARSTATIVASDAVDATSAHTYLCTSGGMSVKSVTKDAVSLAGRSPALANRLSKSGTAEVIIHARLGAFESVLGRSGTGAAGATRAATAPG